MEKKRKRTGKRKMREKGRRGRGGEEKGKLVVPEIKVYLLVFRFLCFAFPFSVFFVFFDGGKRRLEEEELKRKEKRGRGFN